MEVNAWKRNSEHIVMMADCYRAHDDFYDSAKLLQELILSDR